MLLSKRWVLISVLLTGVVGMTLLFSLQLEKVMGASDRKTDSVSGLSQENDDLMREPGGLGSSGTYTVFLPAVAKNAGALPLLFGVQMYGTVTHTTGLTKVTATGARWIRLPISWSSVEPDDRTPDEYSWGYIDAQVQVLRAEEIEPLLTLGGNPGWAADYSQGPVRDITDLQEFIGALVERYDGDGKDDAPGSPVVRYWEFYNEPDNADEWHAETGGWGYFGHRGDQYAAMLDAVYPVVKAASPDAQVVFGGVAHDHFEAEGGIFDPGFIDDVLASCTGLCFDVMNFHYYPFYRHRWESYGRDVIGKANYIRSKLMSYGFDRPLICTETTWPIASTWGSEVLQARYVVAVFARSMADGLVMQNWYAWRDTDPSLPGLMDNDLEPRPAYFAYKTLTAELGQAQYVRPLSDAETGGGNVEGYVFSAPGATKRERVDVIWYDCPEYLNAPPGDCSAGASQVMYVSTPAVLITDMYGNVSFRNDYSDGVADGKVKLEVFPDPVFVRYDQTFEIGAKGTPKMARQSVMSIGENGTLDESENRFANCRFGVGVVGSDLEQYDVAALNLGWYVNWRSGESPQTLKGMEYVQMIRLQQMGANGWGLVSPEPAEFTATVQSNPGALWLVGNEPDSPFQDDMVPLAYARAYHDVYYMIKELDPTAQVGIGGIVQPTPIRFDYLDAVWDTYYGTYGEKMPVDYWNIHSFILREKGSGQIDPDPCGPNTIPDWGAFIPPGITAQHGELYCVRDQDNLEIFWQRIRDFRQWMADNGERDKPLIITEYGVLFPEDFTDEDGMLFGQERVGKFMTGTFDLMLNDTDPNIGYPYDGNRLVQRWAWYSLNGAVLDYGGTLFDPETRQLRTLGETFRDYASGISPTVDLLVAKVYATPAVFEQEEPPVTTTLKAVVSNIGNVSTIQPISVTFFDGPPGEAGTHVIGEVSLIHDGLQGCADYEMVDVEWTGLDSGSHRFYVQVTGIEADPVDNNVADGMVLVASHRVFLPIGAKQR